jgi:CheY-like chemotaxis protein
MSNVILLVDDEPVFNFIADSHIKRIDSSSEVFSVHNGKEALDFLHRAINGQLKMPTHIFLDLNMPVMDGFTFLHEYKKLLTAQTNNTKVVVLTSSNNPWDKAHVQSYDIDNYINKPKSTQHLKYVLDVQ